MTSLPYIFLALLINQLLFVVTNGQQDLESYPFALISPSPVLYAINTPAIQQPIFHEQFNIPHTSYDYKPESPETVQLWNGFIEERSRGNLENRILSNELPPVKLHHGYRYTAPALSFSNATNLKNVIYNEMGLHENHISINRLPQGFVLQQPAEIKTTISPLLQRFQNKTDIFIIKSNVPDQQNIQNTTILTPVKDLNFPFNNAQQNFLNNLYKNEAILNHYNSKYQEATQEELKNKSNKNKPSVLNTAHLPQRQQDLFNIAPSGQIYQQFLTGNNLKVGNLQSDTSLRQKDSVSNFSTTQHLKCANKTLTELRPLKNKTLLNIRPSLAIFENIHPGNAAAENFYPFDLQQHDVPFVSEDQQHLLQHENLKLPLQTTVVNKKNPVKVQPTSEFLPVYFPYRDESSGQSNDKVFNPQFPHQNKQKLQYQEMTFEPYSHDNTKNAQYNDKVFNSVLAKPEYNLHPIQFLDQNKQQLQYQEMPFKPYSQDNTKNQEYYFNPAQQNSDIFESGQLNNKNLIGGAKLSENIFSYPINQPENIYSHYSSLPTKQLSNNERLITKPSYENSLAQPVIQYNLLNKYPPTKYQQSITESYFASNLKNDELQTQQNYKIPNSWRELKNQSNINNLLQPSLSNHTFYSSQIKFPTNNIVNNTSNYMSVVPVHSKQYFKSNLQNSNEFSNLGSNHYVEYPEENYKTSPFITNSQNKILPKPIGTNSKSVLDNIQLQQQHNRLPLNGTLLNILLNQNPFRAQQSPVLPTYNVLINPRTANNRNEISSLSQPQSRSVEFPLPSNAVTANNPVQQNYQSERPSQMSQENLRLPHLIYGSPT